MKMINRTAVVIKPRQPFLDWINHTPQLDLTSPVTMEELSEDCDEDSSNYQLVDDYAVWFTKR